MGRADNGSAAVAMGTGALRGSSFPSAQAGRMVALKTPLPALGSLAVPWRNDGIGVERRTWSQPPRPPTTRFLPSGVASTVGFARILGALCDRSIQGVAQASGASNAALFFLFCEMHRILPNSSRPNSPPFEVSRGTPGVLG